MTQRMSIRDVDPEVYKAVGGLNAYVARGTLGKALCALVDIRASQINKCAWCLDMHTEEAREAGIEQRKIDIVAAWHEAGDMFSAREQAALALTEAVTLISVAGVSDEIWEAVTANFDEKEIAHLIVAIGAINVWNRIAVGFRSVHPTGEA